MIVKGLEKQANTQAAKSPMMRMLPSVMNPLSMLQYNNAVLLHECSVADDRMNVVEGGMSFEERSGR